MIILKYFFVQTSDIVYLYKAMKLETGLYCSSFYDILGTSTIFIFEGGVTGQVNEYLPNILGRPFLHLEKWQQLPANIKKYYIKARLAKYWKVINCILCLFLLFYVFPSPLVKTHSKHWNSRSFFVIGCVFLSFSSCWFCMLRYWSQHKKKQVEVLIW